MKAKPSPRSRTPLPSQTGRSSAGNRQDHNDDLYFYAQAVHNTAKKLNGTLELGVNPLGDFDAYPVLFMYRHAVELFLKAMVLGEGGNFLENKPDHISVNKTRSVPWLAQFVSQIVTALRWERMFSCEGVEDLAAFKKLVDEVNSIDVGHMMFHLPSDLSTTIPDLVRRVDALLDLLDSTADALAAEWDMRTEGGANEDGCNDGGDFKPTIQ